MSNVTKFYPKDAAKNPDMVLEQAIGEFKHVIILGVRHDDAIEARLDLGFEDADMLYVMEQFKHDFLSGQFMCEVDFDD